MVYLFPVHLKSIGAIEVGAGDPLAPKGNVVAPFVIHTVRPPVAFLKMDTNLQPGENDRRNFVSRLLSRLLS